VRDTSSLSPGEQKFNSEVAVLFSGGSDSTLAASMLIKEHNIVHLLTYKHRAMTFEKKCIHSLQRLCNKYGKERFKHSFFNINPIFDSIFFKLLPNDLREYGTYALPMCCGACKLSMHVQTILYCREHRIQYAADGSNVELSELFPEQMISVLNIYKRLYERFGISYSNPVFDINRSDFRLYERGITRKREYKSEHVFYSNQHSCFAGFVLYSYTLGVSLPMFGCSSKEDLAADYIEDKIEKYCIPFLERKIEGSSCPAVD